MQQTVTGRVSIRAARVKVSSLAADAAFESFKVAESERRERLFRVYGFLTRAKRRETARLA